MLSSETIEYVPVKLFSERLEQGWRMVAGYPLMPGDFAVLMVPPSKKHRNNKAAGYVSREVSRLRNESERLRQRLSAAVQEAR